jgi:hypothetical protein
MIIKVLYTSCIISGITAEELYDTPLIMSLLDFVLTFWRITFCNGGLCEYSNELWVPKKVENFLTSGVTISFSWS